MADPTPVTVHGLTLGSIITGTGVWTGVIALIGYWIKSRAPMRKIKVDADERLRDDLIARVEKLEKKVEDVNAAREAERTQHQAELSLYRHRLNNVTQCLDTVFMLLEATPERVVEVVQKIREMRTEQMKRETMEAAQIRAAAIVASAPVPPPVEP